MHMYSVAMTVDGRHQSYAGMAPDHSHAAMNAMVAVFHFQPQVTQIRVRRVRRGFHLMMQRYRAAARWVRRVQV